jgi:hypothetical protein
MSDLIPWIPPAGEVVEPPVANWRKVDVLFSDRDEASGEAGDFNWSGFGDGPKIIAYSVIEEFVEKREPREWWITSGYYAWDTLQEAEEACDYGDKIIHVREVLPEAPAKPAPDRTVDQIIADTGSEIDAIFAKAKPAPREVVAWAVVRGDGVTEVCFDEVDAVREARKGGTVVRLTGFLP